MTRYPDRGLRVISVFLVVLGMGFPGVPAALAATTEASVHLMGQAPNQDPAPLPPATGAQNDAKPAGTKSPLRQPRILLDGRTQIPGFDGTVFVPKGTPVFIEGGRRIMALTKVRAPNQPEQLLVLSFARDAQGSLIDPREEFADVTAYYSAKGRRLEDTHNCPPMIKRWVSASLKCLGKTPARWM
jgi:hypothetical protein